MKNIKHIALTVLVALVSNFTAFAYNVKIDGIYYGLEQSGHYETDSVTGNSVYVSDYYAYVTHDNNYVDVDPDPTNTQMELQGGHYSGNIVIPSSIEHEGNRYSVVGVYGEAFYKCNELLSVSLPETVTSIGYYAFRYCSSLTSITLPKALKSIGYYAFYGCSSLTSITLPETLTSIEFGAFFECSSLISITLPETLTSIGEQTFYRCSNLKDINIPASVKNIGEFAFSNCSSLEEIVLPEGLQYIASNLFSNCRNLKRVNIPSSVISFRSYAFSDCLSLNSITIPENSSISFENNAFNGYNGLIYNLSDMKIDSYSHVFTEKFDSGDFIYGKNANGDLYLTEYIGENDTLVLPDDFNGNHYEIYSNAKIKKTITSLNTGNGITELPKGIFSNFSALNEVTIGKSLVSAGSGVFAGCKNIKTLNYNAIKLDNKDTNDSWGWTDANGNYYSGKSPLNFPLITTLKFGKDVEIIPNNMVRNNKNLTTVNFADGIKADAIGDKTFYNCQNLQNILFGEHDSFNFKTIGAQAFYNCSKLNALNLENVETFGAQAFYGCTGFEEVTIGKNLVSAGSGVFAGCKNIRTLNYNAISFDNKDTSDSWSWNDDGKYYFGYSPLNFPLITTLNFGKGVEIIPNNMVQYNKYLETVIFADGIKADAIGDYTFYNCTNLRSINLYVEPEEIVDEAENSEEEATGEENEDENEEGDEGDEETKEVMMTEGVCIRNIGNNAFANCSNLTSLDLRGVETIGNNAFGGIRISNLTLGKKVSSISNNAFSFNSPLDKLTVGNNYGLNYMLSKEYYDSNNYKYTRIIKNLVIAEDFAETSLTGNFSNQNLLETIESKTVAPLAFAEASPFTDEQYGSVLVTVPEESKEAYKAARIWELFYVTSGDRVVKLYNGNSDKLMIVQKGMERPEEATEKNAVIFVDEQLEADSELLNMGNVIYRDEQNKWIANDITLVDAQPFYTPTDAMVDSITYKRNFTSTNLQALYLPYAMSYDDWKDKAKVSYINGVHQFDDDDDGEIDRTVLEFISVKSGDLAPNIPYLIKPLEKGEATFTSKNKTLKATLSDGYIDCSTTRMLYTLRGTYQTRDDIYANGYYAMSGGTFKLADNAGVRLSPFRILLSITNRYGSGSVPRAKKITIMVDGVEEETTNIDDIIINDAMPTENYNLQGIRVGESYKGIVIKNGRKVLVK